MMLQCKGFRGVRLFWLLLWLTFVFRVFYNSGRVRSFPSFLSAFYRIVGRKEEEEDDWDLCMNVHSQEEEEEKEKEDAHIHMEMGNGRRDGKSQITHTRPK